ncbi:MAG: iron chaperone [Bacteroidia bacterium]
MPPIKHKTVDAYISASPPESFPSMQELRKLIKTTVPKAEEGISWNVPFYKYNGPLAGFAVYKNHVSLGFPTGILENGCREALEKKGYTTGLKTIQIKFDQKLPSKILKQILKEKAKINETKKSKK